MHLQHHSPRWSRRIYMFGDTAEFGTGFRNLLQNVKQVLQLSRQTIKLPKPQDHHRRAADQMQVKVQVDPTYYLRRCLS
jgi:hypothetical protein